MKKLEAGRLGEDFACEMLRKMGFEIIRRNYHTRRGEVDIIAENDEFILFVEVKLRKVDSLVSGEEAVNASKRRKIYLAATDYLMKNPVDRQPRFDVVSLVADVRGEVNIINCEYYENAFGAEVCDEVF